MRGEEEAEGPTAKVPSGEPTPATALAFGTLAFGSLGTHSVGPHPPSWGGRSDRKSQGFLPRSLLSAVL